MHSLILLKVIFHYFRRNKLRTILAMSGIIWGTLAVILLQAIGTGYYQKNLNNISSINNNAITVYPGSTALPYKGLPLHREIFLKASDIANAKRNIPQIKQASPNIQPPHSFTAKQGKKSFPVMVSGIGANYLSIQTLAPSKGRFFNQRDIDNHVMSIIIGYQLKQTLFSSQPAIDRTVIINHIPFKVIGITDKNKGGFMAYFNRNSVYIPYTTAIDLYGNQNVSQALFLPKKNITTKVFQEILLHYFANQFHFSPKDSNALYFSDNTRSVQYFNSFFLAIRLFLFFAGAMTLGVGCIGVTNIMFLIAQERTFEIGLKMALGAKTQHILIQFLLEAVMMVLLGGLIGFIIAESIIESIDHLTLPAWLGVPHISLTTTFITIAVLCVAAVLSGWFPAQKAANLHPVDALREG